MSHDKTLIIWKRRIPRQLYRQLHDHSHIVSDRVMFSISRDKTLIIRDLTCRGCSCHNRWLHDHSHIVSDGAWGECTTCLESYFYPGIPTRSQRRAHYMCRAAFVARL